MGAVERRVGANLARLRRGRHWPQAHLGDLVSGYLDKPWSRQAVSAAEKGRRAFTVIELVAIAEIFGVSLDALVLRAFECPHCHGAPPTGFHCGTCGAHLPNDTKKA